LAIVSLVAGRRPPCERERLGSRLVSTWTHWRQKGMTSL
jgi:hypothetical protein